MRGGHRRVMWRMVSLFGAPVRVKVADGRACPHPLTLCTHQLVCAIFSYSGAKVFCIQEGWPIVMQSFRAFMSLCGGNV